ncbi:MAG: HigA family addiction module antidote protein [Ignavibacteria bacterium]|nr:HigA family addiction module antidote protein [Ignavibacteria bacterium]
MTTKEHTYKPQIAFHPGETLREKLDEMNMGPKEFAVRTGKPEKTVIAILNTTSSVTPEMAVRFEHVLKIPAHFWLNMQRHYDEYVARERHTATLKEQSNWARGFPIADMVKKGWIPERTTISEKTQELLSFFSVSNHEAWANYYLNQELKVAFRISLEHVKEPHAVSAWLRKGELQAANVKVVPYNEQKFKSLLPKMKSIMSSPPNNFFKQLQSLCLQAGVIVVHTPCIKNAPINGCTRWLNHAPLIQLSGRNSRNDIFWFTFFHEAGHILLHGKKDIFLEDLEYSECDAQKEYEADEFAKRWTLTTEQESEVLLHMPLTEKDVIGFAKKFKTHPAIIVGRLQRSGHVRRSFGAKFFVHVELE